MNTIKIIDKQKKNVVGSVICNHVLSFDAAMIFAGFVPDENGDGWRKDGKLYTDVCQKIK